MLSSDHSVPKGTITRTKPANPTDTIFNVWREESRKRPEKAQQRSWTMRRFGLKNWLV
jgi:hypothetical protein